MSLPLLGGGRGGGGGTGGAEATAFLARTTGLDATHINAYIALIDGLVADGIWSAFDALYVYATQDSTTALLNLVSTNYNCVSNGSPTFTADRGFTGANNSTSMYLDTQFNPQTASSPQYTQNSAHVSVWNTASVAGSGVVAEFGSISSGHQVWIIPRYSDGNTYLRVNDGGSSAGFSDSSGVGHYLAVRPSSSSLIGYKDGSQVQSISSTSVSPASTTFYALSHHDLSLGSTDGSGNRCGSVSYGSQLDATKSGNYYTRMRTYMTAVGAP